ncbi:RhoGAP-domain-containing protein [Thelephora ganbajun]|uniref:RhoGAP-domain-containing protein n=1 Tax=Thelephora ganbajun TaxID=370292 RepID=A0ACB6ZN81_THEGA|nr:RhoGAP-domain-containing protein [Thelephora ganbajun]
MDAESPASLSSSGTGKSTADQMANQHTPVPYPARSPSPFVPPTSKPRRFHLPLQSVTGTTNGKMGQIQSTSSNKLKRAFGPRWKKPDETEKEEKERAWDKNRDRSEDDNDSIPAQALPQSPLSTSLPLLSSNPPPSSIARHLGRLAPRKLSMSSPVPPPPIQFTPAPSPPPPSLSPQPFAKPDPSADDNTSLIINSPGISAAVQFMRQQESPQVPTRSDDPSPTQHVESGRRVQNRNDSITKDDWRKSDSTMASHITIRPGAGLPKATRPVSLAESAHSVNTIVPSSRRVSMIVPDSDLVEENDSDPEETEAIATAEPLPESPSTPSLCLTSASRRQSTLFGSTTSFHSRIEGEPEPPPSHHSHSTSKRQLLGPSRALSPTLVEANEHGVLSSSNEQFRSIGSGIRGRLVAWTSNHNNRPPSPLPESNRSVSPKLPGGFRQTTLSISGNLAPAAIDLGKRAMEKIGRSWGSKSNHPPGHPLSRSDFISNSTPPPSYKGKFSEYITRSHPNNSGSSQSISLSNSSKHKRRTPDGPSGTWSISSSQSSVSVDDKMSMQSGATGLNLGQIIRGPLSVGGGAAFGRRLADCVRDTAVDDVKQKLLSGEYYGEGWEVDKIPPLQDRLLPALVLRCAQHLLAWGIQEEGLFRLSGRASHVSRLRTEFDQGVDYNLVECDPSDIDPHVISSLFKAYLRELPESILTTGLHPYFEAVMVAEETSEIQATSNSTRGVGSVGPPLPSGPKNGSQMRKPPSLSTLAMPTFNGVRPPSQSSIHALAALVIRLPQENRDLLYTLVELIKATANRSRQTKMPLANLLLVFCPSLNMKPGLLRVLCESEDIWKAPPKAVETLAQSDVEAHENSDVSQPSSVEPSPIADDSESGSLTGARPRNMRARRGAVEMIYAQASDSLLSINSPPDMISPDSSSLRDDTSASDVSFPDVLNENPLIRKPSPPLSSSTESLVTPSTCSKPPSFVFSAAKDTPLAPPMIADQSQPPFEQPPHTITASPIPFPTSASAPATPSSIRKSLTFSNISFPITPQSPSPIHKRSSRPSLNLLFSKKSGSSLRSMSISSPIVQVQLDPKTTVDPRPPILEVPLNETPFRLDFPARKGEDGGNKLGGYKDSGLTLVSPPPIVSRLNSGASTESPVSAMYGTPEGTPSGSVISFNRDSTHEPSSSQQASDLRCPSRLSITFLDEDKGEHEWSTSVLSAVGNVTAQSPPPQVNATAP